MGGGIALCFILFLILNALYPPSLNRSYSTIITDKKGEILHAFLSTDQKWRMKTELAEITPELQKAIVFKEDKYFYFHYGINPCAIIRAIFYNIVYQKRTSGASTITMQVCRMLYPKNRTYYNKITEMCRAIQLEWLLSKKEILQLYLNLVPFGSNIEGVKSASVLFFNKLPNHLSLAEITALAIIPNRPSSLALGKNNAAIITARNKWLKVFEKKQLFDTQTILDALDEPLTAQRKEAPHFAPHFALKLKNQFPNQPIIKTFLDFEKQKTIESIVSQYIKPLYNQNIHNAAVLLINNKTMQVEGYVGSADFYDTADGGQVDGIKAIRSPGSALKPLVYAMAIDEGLLTPKSKLYDVPSNFNGYAPLNFDNKFYGYVSTEFALGNSLNIPAVQVLQQVGLQNFTQKMITAGFKNIEKNKKSMGLSMALGSCGVKLQELTHLYSAFANEGALKPLKWVQNFGTDKKNLEITDTTQNIQLVSANAAYMISHILSQIQRPDLPRGFESSQNIPRVAWKTGTSFGRKDAWSIGYNAEYTIGVWVGNFSGIGVPELNGTASATPLLFRIFNAIHYQPTKNVFEVPQTLQMRWVCAETGMPPADFCTNQIMDFYIPLVSKNEICNHLQTIKVSPNEQYSFCTNCLKNNEFKNKLYPNIPTSIANFYETEHIPYLKTPPHFPTCERYFKNNANGDFLKIISPVHNLEYIIDKKDNNQLALNVQTTNDILNVHWYINNQFYKTCAPTATLFFEPKRGTNTITCVSDKGEKQTIQINVKFL